MLNSFLKKSARFALHKAGGLAALRFLRRRQSGILMFHSFAESAQENLDDMCTHIARHFEPVSLSDMVAAIKRGSGLPQRAITVTVDDGYRDFLLYGHPVFRRHRIPVTIYAVSEFSAGRIWLWTDRVEFGIEQTDKKSLCVAFDGEAAREIAIASDEQKAAAITELWEALKIIPDRRRIEFLGRFEALCDVEFPATPPPHRAALNWDELRVLASEGVEIGSHTATHPILSRVPQADLEREIRGSKQALERHLGLPIRHFCYPNGCPADINEAAIECVRASGYASAVTCSQGLNTVQANPLLLRRIPFDNPIEYSYGVELLAGLHLPDAA